MKSDILAHTARLDKFFKYAVPQCTQYYNSKKKDSLGQVSFLLLAGVRRFR